MAERTVDDPNEPGESPGPLGAHPSGQGLFTGGPPSENRGEMDFAGGGLIRVGRGGGGGGGDRSPVTGRWDTGGWMLPRRRRGRTPYEDEFGNPWHAIYNPMPADVEQENRMMWPAGYTPEPPPVRTPSWEERLPGEDDYAYKTRIDTGRMLLARDRMLHPPIVPADFETINQWAAEAAFGPGSRGNDRFHKVRAMLPRRLSDLSF